MLERYLRAVPDLTRAPSDATAQRTPQRAPFNPDSFFGPPGPAPLTGVGPAQRTVFPSHPRTALEAVAADTTQPPLPKTNAEGTVTNYQEIAAWYDKQGADKVATTRAITMYILQHKLAPRSLAEAGQALDAILSFDREKLASAPGTLIPELMISLFPNSGMLQSLRDVVMDFGAHDVGYMTGLAAAGAIPLLSPIAKIGRTIEEARGVVTAIERGLEVTRSAASRLAASPELARAAREVDLAAEWAQHALTTQERAGQEFAAIAKDVAAKNVPADQLGAARFHKDLQQAVDALRGPPPGGEARYRKLLDQAAEQERSAPARVAGHIGTQAAEREVVAAGGTPELAGQIERAMTDPNFQVPQPPGLVTRWESKSGKHWVELYQEEWQGRPSYHYRASDGMGNLGTDPDQLQNFLGRIDTFQPDAAKTPMRVVTGAVPEIPAGAPARVAGHIGGATPERIAPSPGAAANLGKPNELETVMHAQPLEQMDVPELQSLRQRVNTNLTSMRARLAEMEQTGAPVLGSDKPALYDLQRIDEVLAAKRAPEFQAIAAGSPTAEVTPEGLKLGLERRQKPEQAGEPSVRGGVFYSPAGGSQVKNYARGTVDVRGEAPLYPIAGAPNRTVTTPWYGGKQQITGEKVFRNPLIVRGGTGGRVPHKALEQLKGKDFAARINVEVDTFVRAAGGVGNRIPKTAKLAEDIRAFLTKWGGDPEAADAIVGNATDSWNFMRNALKENIVGTIAQQRGYDSIIGILRRGSRDLRQGERVTEVFDVLRRTYPVPGEKLTLMLAAGAGAAFSKKEREDLSAAGIVVAAAGGNIAELRAMGRLSRTTEDFLHAFPEIARRVNEGPATADEAYAEILKARRNYRRWQGPTAVPETVYHGTNREFDVFSKTRDIGYHFGTRGAAHSRAVVAEARGGDRVIGSYKLQLKNPLRLPDLGEWNPSELAAHIGEVTTEEPKLLQQVNRTIARVFSKKEIQVSDNAILYDAAMHEEVTAELGTLDEYVATHGREDLPRSAYAQEPWIAEYNQLYQRKKYEWLQREIRAAGYDGIVYKNIGEPTIGGKRVNYNHLLEEAENAGLVDDADMAATAQAQLDDSYIVFDPTQIKSTKNLGTFDPSNPNVRLGIAGAALGAQALTDDDKRGLTAAGLIISATGGRINPEQAAAAARAAGRSVREAEKIVQAARAPVIARLSGDLHTAMLADELDMLRSPVVLGQAREAAGKLDRPELLAQASLAGASAAGGYKRTAEMFANFFGPDAPMFAAIMAATSPQAPVSRNLGNALDVFEGWVGAGRPTTPEAVRALVRQQTPEVRGLYAKNLERVMTSPDPAGLMGDPALSGPKVQSFARNLAGDVRRVTLDTWMTRLQGTNPNTMGRHPVDPTTGERLWQPTGHYLAYSARERQTADWLTQQTGVQWTPAMVQETQWGWTKDLAEGTPGGDFTHNPNAMPLAERVGETDPMRIRTGWDVPGLMMNAPHYDVLNRLDIAGELRGAAPGVVPPWPEIGRRDPIVAAAIRDPQTGRVYTGRTHADALDMVDREKGSWARLQDAWDRGDPSVAGFQTRSGRYVTRDEAAAATVRIGGPTAENILPVGARATFGLPAPDPAALRFLAKNRIQPALLGKYRLGAFAGGLLGYGAARGLLNNSEPQTPPYLRPGPGLLAPPLE